MIAKLLIVLMTRSVDAVVFIRLFFLLQLKFCLKFPLPILSFNCYSSVVGIATLDSKVKPVLESNDVITKCGTLILFVPLC